MFERFTPEARQVLVLAREEARLLNHGYIGTESLLLGILSQGDSFQYGCVRRAHRQFALSNQRGWYRPRDGASP